MQKSIKKPVKKTASKRTAPSEKEIRYVAYYRIDPVFEMDPSITRFQVMSEIGFKKVRAFYASSKDDAFMKMQGEFWSPRGEARPLIRSLGLHHTSMSVGDCLYDADSNKMYQCDDFGWKLVK